MSTVQIALVKTGSYWQRTQQVGHHTFVMTGRPMFFGVSQSSIESEG